MRKVGFIHTSPITVDIFKQLATEIIPGTQPMNFLDDTILPQLLKNHGDLSKVEERWLSYVHYAYELGADLIVSACSSVGDLTVKAASLVPVPVMRIDEAMAEEAVARGRKIGVAATLKTTLDPTRRLLEEKAIKAGKSIEVRSALAASAYQRLMAGDKDGHDRELLIALQQVIEEVDVVVLAQASMARVLPALDASVQSRFLTSPRSGMVRVKQVLEKMYGVI